MPVLYTEQQKYDQLKRWGLALLGIGIGYLFGWLLNLDKDFAILVFMAAGCGLGAAYLFISLFQSFRTKEAIGAAK